MGKRTSDFLALVAIVVGAGLGLGLTSLFARSQPAPVPYVGDSSIDVEILRRSIKGRIADSFEEGDVRRALIVGMERGRNGVTPEAMAPRFRMQARLGANRFDREQLERLRARLEEFRREAGELGEFEDGDLEALYQALEGVGALEDLDLIQDLTIDILRSNDDERRKRRRGRRPRRAAEGPGSDAPGN